MRHSAFQEIALSLKADIRATLDMLEERLSRSIEEKLQALAHEVPPAVPFDEALRESFKGMTPTKALAHSAHLNSLTSGEVLRIVVEQSSTASADREDVVSPVVAPQAPAVQAPAVQAPAVQATTAPVVAPQAAPEAASAVAAEAPAKPTVVKSFADLKLMDPTSRVIPVAKPGSRGRSTDPARMAEIEEVWQAACAGAAYSDLRSMGIAASMAAKMLKVARYRKAIGDIAPMSWTEARHLVEKADAFLPKRGSPGYDELIGGVLLSLDDDDEEGI